MPIELKTLADLHALRFDSVIDVRSPAEYDEDHVPGAVNLPVFSNDERAIVGTIYKQESPFKARKVGAAIVARNAAAHIEGALADKDGGWRPLVYCWRGGQRSGAFASILSQIGWRAETIKGGYQSYRRLVVNALYDAPIGSRVVLLDGNTGTAKTEILARLPKLGCQSLDLEGLANHRGSALGGQGDQPSQKAFESALALALARLDPARPVVVEAESSRIGQLNVPPQLFRAMINAKRIEITAPIAARATYLAHAYSDVLSNEAAFCARLDRLVRLQGHAQVADWKAGIRAGELEAVAASLIERHYDPRYTKSRERKGSDIVATLESSTLDDAALDRLAGRIADVVKSPEAAPLPQPV